MKKPIDYDLVRSLYYQGVSDTDIAAHVKCHPTTICQWRHRYNLPAHCYRCNGVDYVEMERLYNLVWTDEEIAKALKCSPITVKKWRTIEGAAPNGGLRKWMEKQKVS